MSVCLRAQCTRVGAEGMPPGSKKNIVPGSTFNTDTTVLGIDDSHVGIQRATGKNRRCVCLQELIRN